MSNSDNYSSDHYLSLLEAEPSVADKRSILQKIKEKLEHLFVAIKTFLGLNKHEEAQEAVTSAVRILRVLENHPVDEEGDDDSGGSTVAGVAIYDPIFASVHDALTECVELIQQREWHAIEPLDENIIYLKQKQAERAKLLDGLTVSQKNDMPIFDLDPEMPFTPRPGR